MRVGGLEPNVCLDRRMREGQQRETIFLCVVFVAHCLHKVADVLGELFWSFGTLLECRTARLNSLCDTGAVHTECPPLDSPRGQRDMSVRTSDCADKQVVSRLLPRIGQLGMSPRLVASGVGRSFSVVTVCFKGGSRGANLFDVLEKEHGLFVKARVMVHEAGSS